MDRAHKISNGIVAGLFGGLIVLWPATELWFAIMINERGSTWWPIGIVGISATVFGTIGLIFGDRFVDWVADNWADLASR